MSIHIVTMFYLRCDRCGIEIAIEPETQLGDVHKLGWTSRGKKDLCKRCSKPKRVPKAKQT